MNRELEPRTPDPRAGFAPDHHASHQTLGGLARSPELKGLLETTQARTMQRNAVIALANIGTERALDILRRCRDMNAGYLGEYAEWAIGLIERRMKRGAG